MARGEFSRRLRKLREKRGISRKALAELCGLSRNSVERYERGERIPSLTDAEEIAEFFGVSLDWLCGRRLDK